jgi:hypothetical protein
LALIMRGGKSIPFLKKNQQDIQGQAGVSPALQKCRF